MTSFDIPVVETARLNLRAPKLEDFAPMAAFYASDRSAFVGGPKDEGEAWRALAAEAGHWVLRGYGRWAVEERETGAFVGIVGLWEPADFPELELGWDLMNGFEGKGYATEAGRAARAYAYKTMGRETLISLIARDNVGSKGVARRLGARHQADFEHAKFGEVEIWRHPSPEQLI